MPEYCFLKYFQEELFMEKWDLLQNTERKPEKNI